ncbi:MAG: Gfo/Idh/MocA family protein [Spirochaetota bacterium]
MNILVIGSGGFALKHAGILTEMEGVRVGAFCSRTLQHAESAAAAISASSGETVAAYSDLSQALDAQKPDAALIVVTPNAHGDTELELVRRRIPFLVEKPIGMDRETPERIAEAVTEAGLITSVAFHLRYLDTTAVLTTMLKATTPVIANGYWMGTLPPPPWWRHLSESGGQFVEQTVHITDFVRLLFGEAESVYASTSRRAITELHADADVPDAGAAIIRMRNGLTVTLANSCVGPESLRTGIEVVTPVALFQFTSHALTIRREFEATEKRPGIDPYRAEIAAFVAAVRTGDTSDIRSSYADALHTHRLTMAIVESARSGAPVAL